MYSIFCCVVFCGVWYVVLRGILCFAVFCALLYFVLHSAHYYIPCTNPLFCAACVVHHALLCTIVDLHYSAFVPRTALCLASIRALRRAPYTLFTNDAVNS